VFANEQSTVIALLPSMEDDPMGGEAATGISGRAGAFFQLDSVGGAKVDLAGAWRVRGSAVDEG
jgi:hypothetical protein